LGTKKRKKQQIKRIPITHKSTKFSNKNETPVTVTDEHKMSLFGFS